MRFNSLGITLNVSCCLAIGASVAGCTEPLDPAAAETQPEAVEQLDELTASDAFELVLGADPDPSVIADAKQLMVTIPGAQEGVEGAKIVIEYMGLADIAPAPEQLEAPLDSEVGLDGLVAEDPAFSAFVGVNLATGNQFRIKAPRGLITGLGVPAQAFDPAFDAGPGESDVAPLVHEPAGSLAAGGASPAPSAGADTWAAPGSDPLAGWSGNIDNRQRTYGLNAGVGGVMRWQTQLGTGCSGALVGPRHLVTAGHCLYNFTSGQWSDDFTVRAGANGTSSLASVFIDNDNIPSGEVLWYFVHEGYINTGARQFDFGVLVTPKRIGGSGTGQAGCFDGTCWFGWATYTDTDTSGYSLWRRGYPRCDPTFSGMTARIDEPCQTGTWDSNQTCTDKPCNPNHLYGPDHSCSVADFASADPDGWNRILHHNCDASAADSGSPLYHKHPSLNWVVLSVQTSQECGATALCPNSPANVLARPMIDTRITPEYSGWITHFRNTYP